LSHRQQAYPLTVVLRRVPDELTGDVVDAVEATPMRIVVRRASVSSVL
jgi:hypothetical protein